MNDYRGSLTVNDFIFLEDGEYSKLSGGEIMFSLDLHDGITARGLKIGDSKDRAIVLYGEPERSFYADENWGIYRLVKNFEQDDELAAKLYGNTVYVYSFHDVDNLFENNNRDSDLVILYLVFEKTTGTFWGVSWKSDWGSN